MEKNKIIDLNSFKSIQFLVFFLTALLILKIVVDNVLGFHNYRIFFNVAIFALSLVIAGSLVYTIRKNKKDDGVQKDVPCSPLILLITAVFVTMMGSIFLFVVEGYIGILFLCLGIFLLFESFTSKITVTENGIIVKYHKIFPFPGILYSFDDLLTIKMYGNIINLKQKQMFLGAKRFLIYDKNTFIKEMEKTSFKI